MKIVFIGNFQKGYVGERADETHLYKEIENLGHNVYKIPRDEWREQVLTGSQYPNVPKGFKADCGIIAKWHHFFDGRFVKEAKRLYQCPFLYFVWDYMWSSGFPQWHLEMIKEADRYLGNDTRLMKLYEAKGILSQKLYYFPMDVSSKEFDKVIGQKKIHDVVFFGSHMPQGDRVEWIKKINEKFPVKIWSWNYKKWKEDGLEAYPAVYGEEFAKKVAESKIVLQFSVNDHCWGYWSNRIGKVLTVGGFLLARYVPGMELFLRDGAEYFSNVEEAIDKIGFYLENDKEREIIADRGYMIGRDRFTSKARVKELVIYIERYLNGAF